MRNTRILYAVTAVICGVIIFFPGRIHTQVLEPTLEQRFSEALSLYNSGQYNAATALFSELDAETPVHPWSSISKLMEAQSLYRIKDYHGSLGVLRTFVKRYSKSSYLPFVHYLAGNIYYHLEAYQFSLREYLIVSARGTDEELVNRAREKASSLFSSDITIEFLEKLSHEFPGEIENDIVQIKISEFLVRNGDRERALRILKPILNRNSNRIYTKTAEQLNTYISLEIQRNVFIPNVL